MRSGTAAYLQSILFLQFLFGVMLVLALAMQFRLSLLTSRWMCVFFKYKNTTLHLVTLPYCRWKPGMRSNSRVGTTFYIIHKIQTYERKIIKSLPSHALFIMVWKPSTWCWQKHGFRSSFLRMWPFCAVVVYARSFLKSPGKSKE